MNKYISLTKIQFKDFFSRYQSSMNVKGSGFGKLLLFLLFISLLMPSSQFASMLFRSFYQIGYPELTITYMYIAAVMFTFLSGIPFIVSVFFYAKDLRFLAALPIKEDTIIFSKLTTVYLYMLGICTVVFGPAVVVYGQGVGFTVYNVILGLLALFLTPILPLLISAIVILPVMRFISSRKRKNLLSIMGGIMLLVVILLIQFTVIRQQSDPQAIQQLFMQEDGLLRLIGMRFPPSVWLTKMVMGSFLQTIYFLGLNLLLLLAIRSLGSIFYRKALSGFAQDQGGAKGKHYFRKRSKGFQLIRRHILIILKQPTFFLNTMTNLIFPVIICIIFLFTGEMDMSYFTNPEIAPYLLLMFAAVITTPALMANLSATAITREGGTFWETKVLPISAKDNLRYRIWTTVILNLTGSLAMGLLSAFLMPLTLKMLFLGGLFCIIATLFMATVDIIINIYRPILNWTNPTAAVKNNLNVMIGLIWRAVFGFLLYQIYKLFFVGTAPDTLVMLLTGILLVVYWIARYLVYYRFVDKFNEITV